MLKIAGKLAATTGLIMLGACVSMPDGPSVMVLPGTGKNFEQFRTDDLVCRQFASQQMGGATASGIAADSGVRSAVVGTLLGAAAGAAIDGGRGAGVGAGAGMAMGGLSGTQTAQASAYGAQQRYDVGFMQCMYAKGHRIPAGGRFTSGFTAEQPLMPRDYYPPPRRMAP
ncbi:YMGG-like glycine zipper-containing protein [Noviherbaspirillum sedimenti]|nr:YMGG-like glycine zipper-containing protein [Noviherbaspirillum sedimenti]